MDSSVPPIGLSQLICFIFCVKLHLNVLLGVKSGRRISGRRTRAYGDLEGDGSTGGACGYGTLVDVKPLKARVGAVGSLLFKGAKE